MSEAAGFWSYVHTDDEGDGGRIRLLAEQVAKEYRIITGDPLDLFVDRRLGWGDEWAQRIDDAIAGTTFFIPIVTPSYFRSEACRAELLRFSAQATRLGLDELILSVYWVPVPDLDANPGDDTDEAVTLVRRYHWADLRAVRLEDPDSAAFRKAVHMLASRLVERAEAASAVQDAPPPPPQPRPGQNLEPTNRDDDDEPGLLDVLADGEIAFEDINQILTDLSAEITRVSEITQAATARFEHVNASGSNLKARLVVTEAYARALDEPSERIEALGRQFAARLVPVDAAMLVTLDLVSEADPTDENREQLLDVVHQLAASADPAVDALREMTTAADGISGFSRSLRRPVARLRNGLKGVIDGQTVIDGWAARALELQGDAEPA